MGICETCNKKKVSQNPPQKNMVKQVMVKDIQKDNKTTKISNIPKSEGCLSILANYPSKKPNLIFELSDDDFQNNMVDNILDKSKKNEYLVIYKNIKSQDLNSFDNNKLEQNFIYINNKNLKNVYIYWLSLSNTIQSISNFKNLYNNSNNKPLIGVSINSIDKIDEKIEQVKQINNTLKQNNLQLAIVKAHFSLLFREYEELVEYCKENDILFFADNFLEHGALSGKYGSDKLMDNSNKVGQFYNSQIFKIDYINKELGALSKKYNTKILQIPIVWGFSNGVFPIININEIENNEEIGNSIFNIHLKDAEIIGLERNINKQYIDIQNIN